MRKLAIVLALLVAGCAGATSDLTVRGSLTEAEQAVMTPRDHVYAARLDFNRWAGHLDEYAAQPPCTETVIVACSDTAVVAFAVIYVTKANNALKTAWVIVSGGGDTPDALLGTARGAIGTLSAYLVAKGIAK